VTWGLSLGGVGARGTTQTRLASPRREAVREIMGHADLSMMSRYLHATSENKVDSPPRGQLARSFERAGAT
jgi:hypothetical protein